MASGSAHAVLHYYANHGVTSDPGVEAGMLRGLPGEVGDLCRIIHGTLIHLLHAHRYRVDLAEGRKREVQIRRIQEKLARVRELDPRPLTFRRPPVHRVVSTCRDHAVMLCAMLREQHMAARVRAGFANYFPSAPYEDHWICEHWDERQRRWIRADAQLDAVQLEQMNINIDPLDVPDDSFLPAGRMWHLCREGGVDARQFGDDARDGTQFVRDYVVRDIMALSRVELLPWDPVSLPGQETLPGLDAELIDYLAICSMSPDAHWDALDPARELMGCCVGHSPD